MNDINTTNEWYEHDPGGHFTTAGMTITNKLYDNCKWMTWPLQMTGMTTTNERYGNYK